MRQACKYSKQTDRQVKHLLSTYCHFPRVETTSDKWPAARCS